METFPWSVSTDSPFLYDPGQFLTPASEFISAMRMFLFRLQQFQPRCQPLFAGACWMCCRVFCVVMVLCLSFRCDRVLQVLI